MPTEVEESWLSLLSVVKDVGSEEGKATEEVLSELVIALGNLVTTFTTIKIELDDCRSEVAASKETIQNLNSAERRRREDSEAAQKDVVEMDRYLCTMLEKLVQAGQVDEAVLRRYEGLLRDYSPADSKRSVGGPGGSTRSSLATPLTVEKRKALQDHLARGIAQVVLFASDMKAKIISEREKNRALEAELDSLAAHVQEETVRVAEERLALQQSHERELQTVVERVEINISELNSLIEQANRAAEGARMEAKDKIRRVKQRCERAVMRVQDLVRSDKDENDRQMAAVVYVREAMAEQLQDTSACVLCLAGRVWELDRRVTALRLQKNLLSSMCRGYQAVQKESRNLATLCLRSALPTDTDKDGRLNHSLPPATNFPSLRVTVINSSERMRAEDEYLLREARKALAKVDVYHANSQHRHFGLEARKGRLPRGDIPQRTSSLETVVLTQPQGDMTRLTGQQIHSEGGYDYVDSADGVDEDMFPCEPSADGLRRLSPRRQLLPEYRLEDVYLRTETRQSLNRTDAQAADSAQ
eukprot:gene616-674_t